MLQVNRPPPLHCSFTHEASGASSSATRPDCTPRFRFRWFLLCEAQNPGSYTAKDIRILHCRRYDMALSRDDFMSLLMKVSLLCIYTRRLVHTPAFEEHAARVQDSSAGFDGAAGGAQHARSTEIQLLMATWKILTIDPALTLLSGDMLVIGCIIL